MENSLAAFRRAVRDGADGVELDVHATADGELVVRHDGMLAGQPISRLGLREVRMHTLENGETIPTLAETLQAIGAATTTFIEVKTLAAPQDHRGDRVGNRAGRERRGSGAAGPAPRPLEGAGSDRKSVV